MVRWERDAVTGLSSLLRSIVIEVTIGFLAVVLFGYARMRVLTDLIYGSVLLFLINGMFLIMRVAPPAGYFLSWSVL